jgi:hypothetical protein
MLSFLATLLFGEQNEVNEFFFKRQIQGQSFVFLNNVQES